MSREAEYYASWALILLAFVLFVLCVPAGVTGYLVLASACAWSALILLVTGVLWQVVRGLPGWWRWFI
ncbi:MAG TPA: hypothetical protein VEA69_12430 [Tepidisphaeraceae bacterium]|nr:hypothetical protein [Tepidisphaeraceae bacterium]